MTHTTPEISSDSYLDTEMLSTDYFFPLVYLKERFYKRSIFFGRVSGLFFHSSTTCKIFHTWLNLELQNFQTKEVCLR